jgi:serine/threonine protein kinase
MIYETTMHYRGVEKLGGGGIGVVYKAGRHVTAPLVCAEVPSPRVSQEPQALEPFQRETLAISTLNHPNINCGRGGGVWM